MKCNRCTKEEELKWPEPYKKGDLPIRYLDGQPHICLNNLRGIEIIHSPRVIPTEKCNICHKPFTSEWKGHLHRV